MFLRNRVPFGIFQRQVPGSASLICDDATLTGTGSLTRHGSASLTCADATLTGAGSLTYHGTASLICADATVTGAGSLTYHGSASLTCADATATGAAIRTLHGNASIECEAALLAAHMAKSLPLRTLTVPRYRDPDQRYRDIGLVYRKLRTGGPGSGLPTQPSRRGWTIRIYDRQDILLHVLSSNAGRSILIDCSFEMLSTGPGAFDLTLTDRLDLRHGYRVDVHLWNNPEAWYSGLVQQLPSIGTAKRSFKFSGFGFFGLAEKVLFTGSFPAGTRPSQIAETLAKAFQTATNGRVIYSANKIALSSYQTQGEIKFLRTPLKTCMQTPIDLAGDWEWGVDSSRHFFFRKVVTTITDDSRWWVGYHVEDFEPTEDSSKIANEIYVKLGKVRTDLDPNADPLWNTNFLEDESTLIDEDSQTEHGKCMAVYAAPSMLSVTDAIRAGGVELARRKDPILKARVPGVEFTGTPITVQGLAQITPKGGAPAVTFPKKKVKITIQGARVRISVDLGDLDLTPGILQTIITRAQAEEQLSRQVSQGQASAS